MLLSYASPARQRELRDLQVEVFELQRLGIAFGLGLLVGLQRQRADSAIGGIRTFPLIALCGGICSLLAIKFGGLIIAVGLLCIFGLVVMSSLLRVHSDDPASPGVTTEVAALLVFAIGALAMFGQLPVVLTVGAGMAVMLHFKQPLHSLMRGMEESDMRGIMQFVLIALVILPVLPNKSYGPFDLLNPFETWMVVVLIVGISLSAYLIYKVLDSRLGAIVGGILGGLISSTATTIEFARKVAEQPKAAPIAATIIAIASTMSVARVIVEVFVIAPSMAVPMALPCGLFLVMMILVSITLFMFSRHESAELGKHGNPAQLKSAIVFGLLYTLIGFAVAVAKEYFGANGLYVVAAISGLTDVDALTVSTAQMAQRGVLDAHMAWQAILVAVLSNTLFKTLVAIFISRGSLSKYLVPACATAAAVGIATILYWPQELTQSLAGKTQKMNEASSHSNFR